MEAILILRPVRLSRVPLTDVRALEFCYACHEYVKIRTKCKLLKMTESPFLRGGSAHSIEEHADISIAQISHPFRTFLT